MLSIRRLITHLAFALFATVASAQDIGTVQFASGASQAQRGATKIAIQQGSAVREGDVITTGADGHLQLEMVDGARIAMRPRSVLRLERYEFNAAQRDSGSALLSLLNGTMRVFTGAIVSRDRNRFQMKTNLATVGIRGSGNILANLDGTETLNHTLTGAHSITSVDSQGVERTLVSRPGQTVQVLPRQAPRYVPTPPLILSAASQPATARAAAAEKAGDAAPASTAGAAPSAATSSSSTSSGTTPTAASTPADSPPASPTTAATTTTAPASAEPASVVAANPATPTTSASVATTNPTVTASQATTGTVGSSIAAAQPAAGSGNYDAFVRFFSPIASGFEGVLGQSDPGSTAVFDSAGRLVRIDNATISTFLAGPGALPAGYDAATFTGDITFSGGTHRDGFRSPDASVILGRWEGGTVVVEGARSFDLGPRSVSYQVVTATPAGVVGAFTGSATYTLAAATTPTDSAGRAGSLGSASITANFSSRTIAGTFGLSINGQSFTLNGNTGLDPGSSSFAFASALQSLGIACSGNCATQGYLGTMNGQFAGESGRWIAMSYRINPVRVPNAGFTDFITGSLALESSGAPNVGIVLPQTGTASLVFNGVDASRSISTYAGAAAAPSVTGSLQANFTSQTVSFNATVSGGCGCTEPTFTATASGVPIVGAGFSASTDTQRPSRVGAMTLACTGSACGSGAAGRFDGLFRNNAGTTGIAVIVVGDSGGAYEIVTTFGTSAATLQLPAADARAAAQWTAPASPAPILAHTIGRPAARIAHIQ